MSSPPRTIGPYSVVRVLGRGGMGVVYEGFDPAVGRRVALKVVGEAGLDAQMMARFEREAQLLARVRHPNVVAVHALERLGRVPVLITELIEDARSLAPGPLPAREAAEVVRALADGIEAAHRAGVLHRDLKPDNVVRRADGSVVLLDFGVARKIDSSSLTRTGELVGTPAFMAPEQVVGARDLDARVDVYGLGALLYVLLVGTPPFDGAMLKVLTDVMETDPPWPRERVNAPAGLDAIVRRAMAKAPADRFPSAAAMRDALDEWLTAPVEVAPSRRGSFALVAAALVATAVAALALVSARRDEPREARDPAPPSPQSEVAPVAPIATAPAPTPATDLLEALLTAARAGRLAPSVHEEPLFEGALPPEARSPGRPVRVEFLDARRVVLVAQGASRAVTARVTSAGLEWTSLPVTTELGALNRAVGCDGRVAVGGARGLVLLDLATGQRRRLADTPVVDLVSAGTRLLFSDGQRLLLIDVASEGATPRQVADLGPFTKPGAIRDLELAISPDGAQAIVLEVESNQVLDETRARRLRLPDAFSVFELPPGLARKSVAIAPNGDLALGGMSFQLELLPSGSDSPEVLQVEQPLGKPTHHRVVFSPRGRVVYAATFSPAKQNELVAWTPGPNGRVRRRDRPKPTSGLAVSPDGLLLAVATFDGTLEVWVAGDDVE